ncbi:uncharacterized protein ACRADG_004293 isoform 1-T2 [Cochliomyia hominivorax]
MNQINTETVMSDLSVTSDSQPGGFKVANFAKIQKEPQKLVATTANNIENQEMEWKFMSLGNFINNLKESGISSAIEAESFNSLVFSSDSNIKENINCSNLKIKKELLEFQVVEINSKGDQEKFNVRFEINPILTPENHNTRENIGDKQNAINTYPIEDDENHKIKEEIIILEDSIGEIEENLKNPKIKEEVIEIYSSGDESKEDLCAVETQNNQLIKNPLAFLKNRSEEKKSENPLILCKNDIEHNLENRNIKLEIISVNSELDDEANKNAVDESTITERESVPSSINLKELIIKADSQPIINTQYLNSDVNTNLNSIYSNYNFNSSLEVNLSNIDTDIDEGLITPPIQEVIYNNSSNSTDLLKYRNNIIELSSEEGEPEPITTIVNKEIRKQNSQIRRRYKGRSRKNLRKIKQVNVNKTKQTRGRKSNSTNFRKCIDKDNSHRINLQRKNLHKSGVKTSKKLSKLNAEKFQNFPKPFKLESQKILDKDHNIVTVLPKPMMFKSEFGINIKNNKQYLKPEFQPYVRLQRLKSEELLTPLRTKPIRETPSSHHAVAAKRDLLIQHAFSLKLNRLSLDHDIYRNEQSSLCSRLTPTLSMPTDISKDSIAETDSRYFSSNLRHSSTPCEPSVMYSDHINSDNHRTLLLEIAAERAFINNHLQYFDHSPIQFDLFNNLNDLNVFLKYLLGNVNMH